MSDSWEDWDCDDYKVPILNVQSQEQIKKLEEQKLVEESDNALTKDLFNNGCEEDLAYDDLKKLDQHLNNTIKVDKLKSSDKQNKSGKTQSKQKENEQKQKYMSQKLKVEKAKKKRKRIIWGGRF